MGLFDLFKKRNKVPSPENELLKSEYLALERDPEYLLANFILPNWVFNDFPGFKKAWFDKSQPICQHLYYLACRMADRTNGLEPLKCPIEEVGVGVLEGKYESYVIKYPATDSPNRSRPVYSCVTRDIEDGKINYHVFDLIPKGIEYRLFKSNGTVRSYGVRKYSDLNVLLFNIFRGEVETKFDGSKVNLYANPSHEAIDSAMRFRRLKISLDQKFGGIYPAIQKWLERSDSTIKASETTRNTAENHNRKTSEDYIGSQCFEALRMIVEDLRSEFNEKDLDEAKILAYSSIRSALNSYRPDSQISMRKACTCFDNQAESLLQGVNPLIDIDKRAEIYFRLFHEHLQSVISGDLRPLHTALSFRFEQFCRGRNSDQDPVIISGILDHIGRGPAGSMIWWGGFNAAKKILAYYDKS